MRDVIVLMCYCVFTSDDMQFKIILILSLQPDSEENNEMVFCDGCDICVHQVGTSNYYKQ